MNFKIKHENLKLWFFSAVLSVIAYGFPLANYSLSVDSESPILPDFSMPLGRWGNNIVRYHLFEGHIPYFTLLLGLILLSVTAIELCKLFRLRGSYAYIFCALFLTIPQLSYQLVFTMQADTVPLGFLFAVLSMRLFYKAISFSKTIHVALCILSGAILLMFVLALYQALILIPIVLFLICTLQSTYRLNFTYKMALRHGIQFSLMLGLGCIFYILSVKLFCPPVEGGYLSSYMSGSESENRIVNFYKLLSANLKGTSFYGAKTMCILPVLALILIVRFVIEKRLLAVRFLILLALLILPFLISFFITNSYHPPRIYVTVGIVFALIFVLTMQWVQQLKVAIVLCAIICTANIYYITNLFYSNYRIYNHDIELAKKIDDTIRSKYPRFDPSTDYVYFYGYLPFDHHAKFRLENSEIFGGSLFSWDNGDNYRIINFFRFTDVADYKMIDNKESYLKIKDSVNTMSIFPSDNSVKMIENIVIVKLGKEKGARLWVE